jgi:hypothetical protein
MKPILILFGVPILGIIIALIWGCGTAKAEDDPCWLEKQNARSVCRALGRESRECVAAVNDYKLCRAVASDDPIGGVW